MKRSVLLYTPLCFFLFTSSAYCYDAERAKANLASDFAECAAFYVISSDGLKRAGEDTTLIDEAFSTAYDSAVMFSNRAVSEARIKLSMDEQADLQKHDFSNFAILIEKYGKFCKELLESPENRLLFWLDKK